MTETATPNRDQLARRLAMICLLLALAFAVRALTANFVRAHLDDPGWFPSGIYAAFDASAQDWLDGRASIFWIEDASRTDKAIYAPGYPLWLALIYKATGSRSPATVMNVQWPLDALAILLVIGIAVTAFGWRVGLWAGGIAAFWPLLAIYGVEPLADAPTSWLVLAATWMFLLAAQQKSVGWALSAGALIGLSCWLRANALLLVFFWAAAVFILIKTSWRRRALLAAAIVIAGLLVIAPIIIRNAITFHAFVPTGLGAGTNLLEGVGETERGAREFGAPATDSEVVQEERTALNVPDQTPFGLYHPNGIERDRARTRRALGIIVRHPFWYAGSVMQRMAAVLKYAGKPNGIYGTAGINVTSPKCLPLQWQGGALALLVNGLGMLQSVLRFVLLPLMIVGAVLAFREDWRVTGLIFSTIIYYLLVGSLIHTHIRYGLPMQALLTIFAGFLMSWITRFLAQRRAQKVSQSSS